MFFVLCPKTFLNDYRLLILRKNRICPRERKTEMKRDKLGSKAETKSYNRGGNKNSRLKVLSSRFTEK